MTEQAEHSERICPLLSAATAAWGRTVTCYGHRCAWWQAGEERCAVVGIAAMGGCEGRRSDGSDQADDSDDSDGADRAVAPEMTPEERGELAQRQLREIEPRLYGGVCW